MLFVITSAITASLLLIALLNLLTARRLQPGKSTLRVSLLIPARNEEANLRELLPTVRAHEVLVLNDNSVDGTRELANIAGKPLPSGWLGKPWACEQLYQHATGDILLFCDADVRPEPWAIEATAALMQRTQADVVTAFPRHEFNNICDVALLPLVYQTPIACLLPLRLAEWLSWSSVSCGNGQWIAVDASAMGRIGGWVRVRDRVVDDIAFVRECKRAGLKVVPVIATDALRVKMYDSVNATLEGVSKNILRIPGLLLLTALFLLTLLNPFVYLLRLMIAVQFKQPAQTVLLHPLAAFGVVGLAIRSVVKPQRTWKGRLVRA